MSKNFLYVSATSGVEEEASAFESTDFLNSSAGAGDAGKPIILDANGHVDASMINSADVDHDQTTNFSSDEHFTQANITTTGTVSTGTWASTITVDTISELTGDNGVAIDGVTLKDGDVVISAGNLISLNGETILSESGGDNTLSNINAIDSITETTLEAAIDSLANLTTVGTITTGVWNGSAIPVANGGTGGTSILTAQQNLDLEVGVDVQAYDAELSALAGLTSAANKIPYFTGSGTASLFDFIDDDSMATASATSLASSESIKAYVDATAQGLDVHDPVRLATTANLTATYDNGTSGVGATLTNSSTQEALSIDGVAVVVDDRILVKNQTTTFQNGIYVVTNIGSGSTNWVLTRATDFDNSPGEEIHDGDFFFVGEGTTQVHNGYVQTAPDPITVGTDAITFAQFSGAGQIIAGTGLQKSGNTLSFDLGEMVTGAIANSDFLVFTDGAGSGAATNEKITVTNFVEAIDGSGIVANSGVLDLSLNDLTGAVIDVSADSIAFLDATDSSTKLESIADLATGMAGTGLSASSGALSLDINEVSSAVLDVSADSLIFLDATDSSTKLESIADLAASLVAGVNGLSASGGIISLNFNDLPSGIIDVSQDYIPFIDLDGSASKFESIVDLVSGMAGTGLTASSGQLSISTDGINDTHIDFGTGANQVSAVDIPIADTSTYYTGTDIETALDEIEAQIGGDTSTTFNFTEANVLADNDAIYASLEKLDLKWGDLGNTANGEGASLVGIEDSGGNFTGTDVEAALAELASSISGNGISYTVGTGGVVKGDALYIDSNDTVLPWDTITTDKAVIGVAASTESASGSVTALSNDTLVSSLFVALTNIASLPTAGQRIFWWGNGGTYDFTTSLSDFSSGDYIKQMGIAKNSTDMVVEIKHLTRKI